MEKGRTAILYFAYRPSAEAQRKPVFSNHGHKVNTQFYLELQEEIFSRLSPLGLPVVHIDDSLQRGDGFGERISNAVEDVWAKGFNRVIILGNDCPELRATHFQRAIELLDEGHSSLISTHSGGTGLIALNKSQYNGEHWREIQWQSKKTFDDVFDCLPNCKVMEFKTHEINTLADAYLYLELHRNDEEELVYLIDSILNPLANFILLDTDATEPGFEWGRNLRGPPFHA